MIIHFICRGNSFRSIIAEAYLNSLQIKDLSVLSSGTNGALDKDRNLVYYRLTLDLLSRHGIREFAKSGYGDQLTQSRLEKADLSVCMNRRVYDECLQRVTFPAGPRIWSVADVGEPGRIASNGSERELYREEAYQEIVMNVDRLVSDISAQAHLPGDELRRILAGSHPPRLAGADLHDPVFTRRGRREARVVGFREHRRRVGRGQADRLAAQARSQADQRLHLPASPEALRAELSRSSRRTPWP